MFKLKIDIMKRLCLLNRNKDEILYMSTILTFKNNCLRMKGIFLLVTLIILSLSSSLYSQLGSGRGVIKGKLIDGTNGEALIGANVIIEGTSMGATSNLDGDYTISNVREGTISLVFRYLGYKVITKEVNVAAGQTVVLNMTLEPQATEVGSVIVTAQARGQMAAINQERASNTFVNIVSADKMKDVPDVNAAESIGRLPGVSLQRSGGEGNQVVVRGLSPQFTIVQVDGVRLTGVDLDRGVGLSAISSDMLDGIELSKSLTADKDADAIGGVVNLRTRTAQEGFHFGVELTGGYNDLEKTFKDRAINANISNRFWGNRIGLIVGGGTETVTRSNDRFLAEYASDYGKPDIIDSVSYWTFYTNNATIRHDQTINTRHNGSLVLDFKTDFMTLKFNNSYNQKLSPTVGRKEKYDFATNSLGGRSTFTLNEALPDERIQNHSVNALFKFLTTELSLNASYSKTTLNKTEDIFAFRNDYGLINPLTTSIPDKERKFNQADNLLDYYAFPSTSENSLLWTINRDTLKRKDLTKVLNADWKIPFAINENISGKIKVGFKYSNKERNSDKKRENIDYNNDPVMINNTQTFVDNSLLSNSDIRKSDPSYIVTGEKGLPARNFDDPNYKYGDILNGKYNNTIGWSPDLDKLKTLYNAVWAKKLEKMVLPDGLESNKDDYEMTENLTAGYIMAEINIGKRIIVLPGIRYERMHTIYNSFNLQEDEYQPNGIFGVAQPTVVDTFNAYFFPSINTKFQINDKIDIRAAYFMSTSRPDFNLLSPGMVLSAAGGVSDINAKNPFLLPSTAHNFEFGTSFYSEKIGLISASVFHKRMTNFIYKIPKYDKKAFDSIKNDIGVPQTLIESLEKPRFLYPRNFLAEKTVNINNYPVNNPYLATLIGFELSWQTNFRYLPGLLSGFVLDLNYTFIRSHITVPYIQPIKVPNPRNPMLPGLDDYLYKSYETNLIDQPNSIVNARLGWDYKGFSSRVSFNFQGKTIDTVDPVYNMKDGYKMDSYRWDLTLKQKIVKGLSVSVDLMNITALMDKSIYTNYNTTTRQLEDWPREYQFYGFTAQAGLKYDF